jgi:hypothetical protein
MTLTNRPTVIYNLHLPEDAVFLRPESVILRFENRRTVDIGAICYLQRESGLARNQASEGKCKGSKVDLDSFSQKRSKLVPAIIKHISDELMFSGKRPETVRDSVARFLAFMNWVDINGLHNALDSVEIARGVIQSYVRYLRERVLTNSISINGAARQQSAVASFIGRFLAVDNLTRDIRLLRVNQATKEITHPPSESAQARILTLCETLFDGLTTFLLANKPYPLALNVPSYLKYPMDIVWVFPTTQWCIPRKKLLAGKIYYGQGYNFYEGRLSTLEEILATDRYADDSKGANGVFKRTKLQLHEANADIRHSQRKRLGLNALKTFFVLFLAQTGMSLAQVFSLPWSDQYEVSNTLQNFRTIKYRADSKVIFFELPLSFMPRFREYLELRRFILGAQTCDYLFFSMGLNGTGLPSKLENLEVGHIYNMLRRLDPDIKDIKSRQWRAAKSDWLLRNTDPSTTALVLQNTEKTVLAHYAAGSETVQIEEVGSFLNKVSEMVIDKGQVVEGGVDRAVGYCSSYGAPKIVNGPTPIQPDCKVLEGCFFCEKYRVHADETDARKLISCRYFLQQTIQFAGSDEVRTKLIYVIEKVEKTLSELSLKDKDLVIRITKEVHDDGEFDPYWARKLEMLMEIGLIQ